MEIDKYPASESVILELAFPVGLRKFEYSNPCIQCTTNLLYPIQPFPVPEVTWWDDKFLQTNHIAYKISWFKFLHNQFKLTQYLVMI